jgi:Fe-S cluster assembly protein SufD
MDKVISENTLKDQLANRFEQFKKEIFVNDSPVISKVREEAFQSFLKLGFPDEQQERWRNTDLSKTLAQEYEQDFIPPLEKLDAGSILRCEIPHFDTVLIALYNGWYLSGNGSLITRTDGTMIGSLAMAMKQHPMLVEEYFTKYDHYKQNGLDALNTAFAQDGIFIYVPDNVQVNQPVQMVNMIDHDKKLFLQNRNIVILGKNSKLTLIHCDDSLNQQTSFTNTITEIFLGENASIDHYKLQNINNNSSVVNSTCFHQEKGSRLTTSVIVLNGGLIRNDINVKINGESCNAKVYGLYLVDKNQHVDNQVTVDHLKPYSSSTEMFKGIIDDQARAVFNGHILVHRDAQKTNAYQTNKNLLLTDKASVNTKPFLEIYADDVKCSHGATIGQLDLDALFYFRSRGLSRDNARLLLMYAFAAEIINKISIEALRMRIDDLVKKRLRGELSICDQCVLDCRTKENTVSFEIDMSKI